MSSSQQPSNNSNNNNLNYQNDESIDSQRYPQRQIYNERGQSYENGLFQQMYPFQEDADEDLPHEIVAELNTRRPIRPTIHDEDESVFSDVVQDAFRKYQNEMWDNSYSDDEFFDDEQDELYAQMEECWNYMTQENDPADTSKASIEQLQAVQLNPDASEFKPSWLKSTSTTTNEQSSITLPSSSQHVEEEKKI